MKSNSNNMRLFFTERVTNTFRWLRKAVVIGVMICLLPLSKLCGQTPTFTVTVDTEHPVLYWLESVGAAGFYAVPHTNNQHASTTNAPVLRSLWYFLNAGIENGTQYYYIVNRESGKYLWLTGSLGSNNTIQVKDLDNNNTGAFKFSIAPSSDGNSWVIYPSSAGTNYWVNKQGGNVSYGTTNSASYWLKSSNYGGSPDGNSKWKFIPKDDVTWPRTQLPFMVSAGIEMHYYNIQNAKSTSFFISYDDDDDFTTVSNVENIKRIWYFKAAGVDDEIPNLNYYYIVNGNTGKYIKFTATTINGSNQNDVFKLADYDSNEDDCFRFVVVNAIGDNHTGYSIMPKLAKSYYANQANSMMPNSASNNAKMSLRSDRGNNYNAHWEFVPASNPCASPVFQLVQNQDQPKVEITSTTVGAVIYYSIGDELPVIDDNHLYTEAVQINPSDFPVTIKAIAVLDDFISDMTQIVVDKVANPVIQESDNYISITCTTPNSTIYYTTDNSQPYATWTQYTGPFRNNVSGVPIRAIAVNDNMFDSDVVTNTITLQCEAPIVQRESDGFRLICEFPGSGVTIYYTVDGSQPSPSASVASGTLVYHTFPVTVRAFATAPNYNQSPETQVTLLEDLSGSGTANDPYLIELQDHVAVFVWKAGTDEGKSAWYKVTSTNPLDFSGAAPITQAFTGHFDGNLCTLTGLTHSLFNMVDGGTVKNVTLKNVNIQSGDSDGDAGAICNKAEGSSRIYNCGILPTVTTRDEDGNITGFSGSSVSGTRYVGGLVGLLSGTARVINCYSYANVSGGDKAAGIVGNNTVATTANPSNTDTYLKTMVMNCMFYGNITGASTMKPVYGGQIISNAGATGINNYNYYRNGTDVTFDNNYEDFGDYYCSLPADEEYLTRFEYYRSIFNCNRKLCVWWITGHTDTEQTAEDGEMMAKWVLDPEIAPFPILKKWGKYTSVINKDPDYTWNPETMQKVSRASAEPFQGKKLGTVSVTINAGAKHAGNGLTTKTLSAVVVTDMDTLNHDYSYYKIQLPYYNEQFGDPSVELPDPSASDYTSKWNQRYAGNYKDYVVTGWKITSIEGGTPGSFKGYAVTNVPSATSSVSAGTVTPDVVSTTAWEDGFNFADRNCTNKDLYSKSGRVFAQGGYYYVPEGVTDITIEAYWGKAVYMHNKGHYMDRVNVAAIAADGKDGVGDGTGPDFGSDFTPAGTLSTTFQTYTVKDNLQDAIAALTNNAGYTVYDQAIVLVGNVQVKNRGGSLSSGSRAFTIMSCDLDLDNEPDYCLQFQTRNTTNRPAINAARFDFLPVPELGLAIRTNTYAYAIGIMVPKGHFEITETSFMHTTQFEYDADVSKVESPLILNGGHFEQIVVRRGPKDKTSYIIMGGNFRMKRFTPGYHVTSVQGLIRHCAVNAIGGEYPEFYLSGIYMPDYGTRDDDNPHCYTNGGYFGIMAGAGYEQVKGNVTFKIDHSIISEFYGGGINAAKPITGNIDVIINNSLVRKYCGGPKVGSMAYDDNGTTKYRTVTTNATGTTFGVFYGGGNGGTSFYRDPKYDNTKEFPTDSIGWVTPSGNYTPKFKEFTPLNQENVTAAYKDTLGYHAEYEFEVFNASNGLTSSDDVIRLYYHWAQFGTTTTGDVTNTLTNCTITGNFFGGGNLGNVTGNVMSTLKGTTHVYGSAFAAGYSASIPSFPVHKKSTVRFPTKDKSGNVDEQGSLDYYQDNGVNRMYTWCYKNDSGTVFPEGVVIPTGYSVGAKQKSAFRYPDEIGGKWYILTNVSLEGLGAVSGNATLTIDENSVIDHDVFGGGDSSAVTGNTTVNLQGNATVQGNVYGGGNEGPVDGNSEVKIQDE